MRRTIHFILLILLAIGLSYLLPWWSLLVAAFLAGLLIPLRGSAGFFMPFLAAAFYWGGYSWWLGQANDFVMAKRIAILLPLEGQAVLLILVTAVIGGFVAGFSSLSGSLLRFTLKRNRNSRRPLARR